MNSEQLEHFEQFWRAYPRKVGKGAARKFYERALRIATAEEIITGLRSQLGYYATREQQFIPTQPLGSIKNDGAMSRKSP